MSQIYRLWANIKDRCDNIYGRDYAAYGGRGIDYDPRWVDFEVFYKDIGDHPGDGLSFDRIDNNKGYWPGNVRWATQTQQNFNTRTRSDNTSGLKGVCRNGPYWRVQVQENKQKKTIYQGHDFFEACCARKSWENLNVA